MVTARRLGPYVLREEVASGAFSVIYRAEHVELRRQVWIKTLKASVSPGGPLAAALEREARVLARLDHPSIVAIQDVLREDGAPALVLEPVAGPTLAALLARVGRVDPDTAAAIALELARGLGHAHERGVVQAALSPEHVVVTPGGGVKLLEMSAAREVTGAPSTSPSASPEAYEALSRSRPDAMAPEQILGEPPGPPADVFALGVLLHELCAGEGPFVSAEPAGRTVAHRIRHDPPRPLRAVAPEAPRSLELVVLRCLEKDPEQRYPGGGAVAAALEEVLAERGYAPGAAPPLIARALAAAKLGGAAAGSSGGAGAAAAEPPRLPEPLRPRPLAVEARPFLAVLALVVIGGAAIELGLRDHDAPASLGVAAADEASAERGYLRVLARPWAEVVLDGDVVDVTPIGRPIPVAPGRHHVTFRHPNAPDEKREVIVAPGQTVMLDVTLRVERGGRDAGVDAAVRDESP